MKHISFYSTFIATVGYDPQTAILEIRLLVDGKIRRYKGVPEDIWYRLRENYHPDTFYRRHICGHYAETILPDEEENN
ncbi:MAG: KTSC domain-containing protein [Lachnospiraceae bacterium]|nr:KTSC domain-containing protein [Lachnospiraceae bacterium]